MITNTQALALALAGAKKLCPSKGVTYVTETKIHASTCQCKGTGEVYVLGAEVRPFCSKDHTKHYTEPGWEKFTYQVTHEDADCPSWNPLDPHDMRWVVALAEAGKSIRLRYAGLGEWEAQVLDVEWRYFYAQWPWDALLMAATKALNI